MPKKALAVYRFLDSPEYFYGGAMVALWFCGSVVSAVDQRPGEF